MNWYKHVIAAIETSGAPAKFVATRAAEVAQAAGGSLSLIHVVEPLDFDITNPPIQDTIMRHARESLERAAESLTPRPQVILEIGSPRYEITQAAEKESADLIVIGTHGRHGVGRMLGSTASAVVHSARCDVLIVHIPAEID
jgi:universal stress protein A